MLFDGRSWLMDTPCLVEEKRKYMVASGALCGRWRSAWGSDLLLVLNEMRSFLCRYFVMTWINFIIFFFLLTVFNFQAEHVQATS